MVYTIIGHPFAGKSTFVKKVFLKENAEYKNGYYICDKTVILGDYRESGEETNSLNKRHVGIDKIHYKKGELFATIQKFVNEGYDVVVEGIQLFRGSTLKSLAENNIDTTIILVTCNTDTILERSKNYPVLNNKSMIGANKSRLEALYNKYQNQMHGKIINTDELSEEDYKNLTF